MSGATLLSRRNAVVTHPIVLVALATWLINDHALKAAFPGVITGKLSDVAGLVAFPAILLATLPACLAAGPRFARAADVCAGATALVFALVNLDAHVARVVTPIFGLLRRVFENSDVSTWVEPVAHICDAEDLLTLPFALVTPWLARHINRGALQSSRTAWSAAAIVLMLGAPASALADSDETVEEDSAVAEPGPHGGARFELRVDATGGGARAREPHDRGTYDYALGGARLAIDGMRQRARFGAATNFAHATLVQVPESYARFGVTHPAYNAVSVSVYGGYAGPHAEVLFGLAVASTSYPGGGGRLTFASPFARLTFRRSEHLASSSKLGSSDGFVLDGCLVDQGILVERRRFSIRVAVGIGMQILPDIAGTGADDAGIGPRVAVRQGLLLGLPDAFVDVETRVSLTPKISFNAWVQGGSQWPRVRLGVGVSL